MKSQQGQTKKKGLKKRRRNRRLGFLARMRTVGGRRVLKNRRNKKRNRLSVAEETGTSKVKNAKLSRRRS